MTQIDRPERILMKSLARNLAVCGAIALLSSVGMFLLLTLGARLPRIGYVPFSVSCERANTFDTWLWVFVIVFSLGIMDAVLRELRRRAFAELRQRKTDKESGEKNSHD